MTALETRQVRVRAVDVHHWLWRLRGVSEQCAGSAAALSADELARSLRREAAGLYVDAPTCVVPEDLARAVLAVLDDAAACCPGTPLAAAAREDGALLSLALLG